MPELPEVETVVRTLRPQLVGHRLGDTVVRWKRTLGGLSAGAFARAVNGARVRTVDRRAKWIVLDLERRGAAAGSVCVHLRMTGRLQLAPGNEPPGPWERLRIALDDGRALRFIDARKFGRVRFVDDSAHILGELGPEPLGEAFTLEWLTQALGERRRALKPLLLDQAFVAGLGNIYVDETLHRAGLHPLAGSDRLSREQARLLRSAIRTVLRRAIRRRAASGELFDRASPRESEGDPGEFRVYGREGEPCPRCRTPIRRLVVGGRATFVCPTCQPKPKARARRRQ